MSETAGHSRTTRSNATDAATTRRRDRALTIVAAVVGAVVVWLITAVLIGIDLQVLQAGAAQTVGVGMIILFSAVLPLLGWALLAVLERFTRRARIIWTVVAVVVLLASFLGPISSAANGAAAISLSIMHIVVGAVTIAGLRRTSI